MMHIRHVQAGDEPGLIALWHAAGVARPWNDPDRDIAFARRADHSTILIGERDGALMASAMVGEDGHRGWVYYLAVDPAHQGQGLGRQMMAAVEEWLKDRGVWKLQLLVREDNAPVKAFYDQLGYRDTRTTCFQKILE